MNHVLPSWRMAAIVLSATLTVQAQSLQKSVSGNGFSASRNSRSMLAGTFGQNAVGPCIGTSYQARIGFWNGVLVGDSQSRIGEGAPDALDVLSNWPNPFTNQTTISIGMHSLKDVTLKVFDDKGSLVRTTQFVRLPQGISTHVFSATGLTPGRYAYSISDGATIRRQFMTILK